MTTLTELITSSKAKDLRCEDIFTNPQLMKFSLTGKLETVTENYSMNDWGKTTLLNKLGIPGQYINKCPMDLQQANINHWLEKTKEGSSWLLRTIKDDSENKIVRSVLTSKYTAFDNTEILEMVEKVIGNKEHKIERFHQDEMFDGFNMRVTFPEISLRAGKTMKGEVDDLTFGLHIANSEVGRRSISVTPMIYRLVCTNGMMVVQAKGETFKQRHMGVQPEEMPLKVAQAFEKALIMGESQMQKFADTKKINVLDPLKAIADLVKNIKRFTVPKNFTETVQGYLATERIEKKKATVYDIINSFTKAAQTLENEDVRVALETFVYTELMAA